MVLGFIEVSYSSLLPLKKSQSRREARSLVITSKQRAIPDRSFADVIRRAELYFSPLCVALFRATIRRFFCLSVPSRCAGRKMPHRQY